MQPGVEVKTYKLVQHIPSSVDRRGADGKDTPGKTRDISSVAELLDLTQWPGQPWARGDKFFRWVVSGRGGQFTLLAEIDRGHRWFVVGTFTEDPVELQLPEWQPPKYPEPGPPTRQQVRRLQISLPTTYLQIKGAQQKGSMIRVKNYGERNVRLNQNDVISINGTRKQRAFVVTTTCEILARKEGRLAIMPPLEDRTADGAMINIFLVDQKKLYPNRKP